MRKKTEDERGSRGKVVVAVGGEDGDVEVEEVAEVGIGARDTEPNSPAVGSTMELAIALHFCLRIGVALWKCNTVAGISE